MNRIYIVDYGIESDGKTKGCSAQFSNHVNTALAQNGWKKSCFDSTIWKEVDECESDVQQTERILRKLIEEIITPSCKVSLLVICVDKTNAYGTDKNGDVCFGTKFIFPNEN